jgi:cell division protein FtsN
MNDYRNSGTDTVVKIVLVFFISLLSFSIGTFVGKKFSDNQHKMVAMEPTKATTEESTEEGKSHEAATASHEAEATAPQHEADAIADDQVAELEQEMTNNEEVASATAPEKQESVEEHSQERVPASAEEKETEKVAEKHVEKEDAKPTEKVAEKHEKSSEKNEKVAEKREKSTDKHEKVAAKSAEKTVEKAVEAPAPKASSVLTKELAAQGLGKFTIQIASYPSLEEAEKKVHELRALKFESFATEASIKGHSWYRVNVGLFTTVKEAQVHKNLLSERAKVATAIIQKITK